MKTPFGELKYTKQKILYTLYQGRRQNGKFNLASYNHSGAWISGGWLPLYALRGPIIGGDSAGRRVRELHELGWPVINKEHKFVVGGVKRSIRIYALGVTPSSLDWDWKRIILEWPNFQPSFDHFEDELEISESPHEVDPKLAAAEAITDDLKEMFQADEMPTLEHISGILDRHIPPQPVVVSQ